MGAFSSKPQDYHMSRRPKKEKPSANRGPRSHYRHSAAAVCGLLLLAVLLVFGQTVKHDFVNFDDYDYVYENPHLPRGLTTEGIVWAFTTTQCGNWHPLTWLSHVMDCRFYELHAGGHHATNVLLHATTVILLFLVLRRMTGDLWPSAFVAAVFAVHPLRAESVAWVAERKDVLSGLFFVLTLGAYLAHVRRPSSRVRYLTVVLLFALGLMAKPMLVTLPFVLLLLDYWPLGRMAPRASDNRDERWSGSGHERWGGSCTATPGATVELSPQRKLSPQRNPERNFSVPWRLAVEKLPLLVLSAASCVATSLAQQEAVERLDVLPLSSRAANALVSYATYLRQFFCPVGLAAYYPHPGNGLPIEKTAGALLLLAAVTAAVGACWRRCPWMSVGWLWYVGMLVPVVGLVQVGGQSMADRYTYLPQIGLAIALAWEAKRLLGSWPGRGWLCGATSAIVVAVLMGCAWRQTSHWRNNETLWTHTLDWTAGNPLAHYNLGIALREHGRVDEAIVQYRKALKIKPKYAEAHNNLGAAFEAQAQLDEAMAEYRKALDANPNYVVAHNNLGAVLAKRGRFDEAIDHYLRALDLKPDYAEAHLNLGNALSAQARLDEATREYRKALTIRPNYAEAHNSLGTALAARAKLDEAMAEYQKSLKIKPNYAEAHNNLGNVLVGRGRVDDAIARYQKALEIQPDYADARGNLAATLYQQGRIPEAIIQWRELIGRQPENTLALHQMARALASSPEASVRNGAEAVELAERAATLSDGRDPIILDTLAAAYAEAGRFSAAVETARRALELAKQQNKQALVESMRAKIPLYEAGSPYRDTRQFSTPRSGPRRPL